MPTIRTVTTEETETEVTADYCYGKAAEILAGRGGYGDAGIAHLAAEWRLLGDSLSR